MQFWWDRWAHPKSHLKEILDTPVKSIFKEVSDTKSHIKDILDTKSHIKEIIDTGVKRVKEKEKDLVEHKLAVEVVDPFQTQVDPALIKNMIEAHAKMQADAGVKRSPFIQPLMRPMVGKQIMKKENKEK